MAEDYVAAATRAAEKYQYPPALFRRQIQLESNFDPKAYNSRSGASGIAQIVPRWHPGVNPWDPLASLDYAARWMSQLVKQYRGDYARALAAYNWGPGNVASWSGKPADLPRETQQYLTHILGPDWTAGTPDDGSDEITPSPGGGSWFDGSALLDGVASWFGVPSVLRGLATPEDRFWSFGFLALGGSSILIGLIGLALGNRTVRQVVSTAAAAVPAGRVGATMAATSAATAAPTVVDVRPVRSISRRVQSAPQLPAGADLLG